MKLFSEPKLPRYEGRCRTAPYSQDRHERNMAKQARNKANRRNRALEWGAGKEIDRKGKSK